PIPHSHRRDEDEQNMKSSRKGAVRAARLTATLQAHSWIGKDFGAGRQKPGIDPPFSHARN
ncbi:MAG: hypothetical protein ACLQGT_09625, partial [Terracidiphilus sp.]